MTSAHNFNLSFSWYITKNINSIEKIKQFPHIYNVNKIGQMIFLCKRALISAIIIFWLAYQLVYQCLKNALSKIRVVYVASRRKLLFCIKLIFIKECQRISHQHHISNNNLYGNKSFLSLLLLMKAFWADEKCLAKFKLKISSNYAWLFPLISSPKLPSSYVVLAFRHSPRPHLADSAGLYGPPLTIDNTQYFFATEHVYHFFNFITL